MQSLLLRLTILLLLALTTRANASPNQLSQRNMTADWPSLRLNFTLKRSSTQVYGQSAFSVLANPIVSSDVTSVLYDAFATFMETTTKYNYTLVDGFAYISRLSQDNINNTPSVRCLDSDVLPPINSIFASLNEATAISNASTSGSSIECSSGNMFKVSVGSIDFIVCYSGESGFMMRGRDMDIVVEYLANGVEILAPTVNADTTTECMEVALPSSVAPVRSALLTGKPIVSDRGRKLEAAFKISDILDLDESSCSCKSTPRPCIFIHGLGIGTEEPDNLDAFSQYWGNLTDHAPCCSSMKYAVLNTLNNSWTDNLQQEKVCDRALAVSDTSQGTTISDTIIITHSMGGLMLAGAIAAEKCSVDKSSSWVSLSAPMKGSMASNYFQDSCKGETNVIYEKFVNGTGYCPADEGIKSLAYEGDSYASLELNKAFGAAQKAYRRNVYALLCSNGFSGLPSDRQWVYWVLGATVPHKSKKNDGTVEFMSCAGGFPTSKFGNKYMDRFYVTKLNHADTAFRNGDSLAGKAKMPVKWFECLL